MPPSASQLARRVQQFASLLERLEVKWRAHGDGKDCYLVIDEYPVGLTRPRAKVAADDSLSHRSHRGSDTFTRYAQVAFLGDWFYLELPDMTLSPSEGEKLIQARPAFFYLKDRPDSPSAFNAARWAKLVREFNPVHRCYRSGEKLVAAADLAYLWFSLWKVPLDWVFQAKLSYFHATGAEIFSLP
ncbi:MAG: hypothetical protein ACKVP0_07560 [Pirellulaceae bacterium]